MSNWKINGTDIHNYGVHVQQSSALLSVPAWRDNMDGNDWMDEDYKDYWQSTSDVKYADREIVLNCWIRAGSYTDFNSKLYSFYAKAETRNFTLTTPLGEIEHCYITSGIQTVRKTNYKASKSIGVFTLRITVAGDAKEDVILVYPHAGGVTPKAGILTANLKVYKRLRGEMYATCTTESFTPIDIDRGDMIAIPVSGTDVTQYENFYLVTDPEIRKQSTNKYVYNLRFEHASYYLKNVAFKSLLIGTPEEGDFYWFANLKEVLDKIIDNWTATSPFFVIALGTGADAPPATDKKNHKFDGSDCWTTLQNICQTYDVEWDFVSTANASHGFTMTLVVKERIERIWPYTLEYGRSQGLYELTREGINKDELCTVLYAWGAEKNLKADYIYRRLKCPVMPMEANVSTFGRVEKTVFFDDYYPEFSCTVAGYEQILTTDSQYSTIKEQWPDGMYRITAGASLTFDPTDDTHLIGLPPKVSFRDGDLAGFEFEIKKFDADDNYIFIKPSVDEYAGTFPNSTIMPGVGDTFTLIDIAQDAAYVTSGEARLYAAASAYLSEYSTPHLTYRVTIDPAFVRFVSDMGYPEYSGFNIGDSLFVNDTDMAMAEYFRVSELTKDCYTGVYELTLSEREVLTTREQTALRLAVLEKFQNAVKQQQPEKAKNNQESSAELRRRLFEESDRQLALNDIVRNESVDPRMLSFDAGVPQFQVYGCLVDTNYKGVQNDVRIGAGSIEVLNWPDNTERRYEIWKMEQDGQEYDPRRTWIINPVTLHLPNDAGYYLYAKLPMAATGEGEMYASTGWIRCKDDLPDNMYYTLGYINAPSSKRQAAMLWGNRKIYDLPSGGASGDVLTKRSSGDFDAVWTPAAGADNYADELTFDSATRVLTLGRTGVLPDLTCNIPDASGANNYPTALTWSSGDETLTLARNGLSALAVNIPLPDCECDPNVLLNGSVTNVEYGYLYNWWAATDARHITPSGWHIPYLAEFEALESYLGGTSVAGGKLKETGIVYWIDPNVGATNEFGFNGRGAGYREGSTGGFSAKGVSLNIWSQTVSSYYTDTKARYSQNCVRSSTLSTSYVETIFQYGFSVRYIKDDSTNPGTMTGNDGKVYPTVKIGTQVWTACNIAETKYRDGSLITGPTFTNVAWAALTTEAYCIYNDDPDNAVNDNYTIQHNSLGGKQGGSESLNEYYHLTQNEHDTLVFDVTGDGVFGRTQYGWEPITTGDGGGVYTDSVIEFGFNDITAGASGSYDMDIWAEYPYTVKHAVLRTDSGTLTGVALKINSNAVAGLDNLTVTSTRTLTNAASGNVCASGDYVTLNVGTGYTGDPTYIGGHLYIDRT